MKNCTPTVPCSFFWGAMWDKRVSLKPAQVLPSILIHLFGQDLWLVWGATCTHDVFRYIHVKRPQGKQRKHSWARKINTIKHGIVTPISKTGLKLPSCCTSLAVLTVAVQTQTYKHMQTLESAICEFQILHMHVH